MNFCSKATIVFLAALMPDLALSDEVATTDSGQKVILYDDGTWVKADVDQAVEATAQKAVKIFKAYKAIYKTDLTPDVAECLGEAISSNSGEKFTKITFPLSTQWSVFSAWVDSVSLVGGTVAGADIASGMMYVAALNQIAIRCGMPYN